MDTAKLTAADETKHRYSALWDRCMQASSRAQWNRARHLSKQFNSVLATATGIELVGFIQHRHVFEHVDGRGESPHPDAMGVGYPYLMKDDHDFDGACAARRRFAEQYPQFVRSFTSPAIAAAEEAGRQAYYSVSGRIADARRGTKDVWVTPAAIAAGEG
jgi:hypothetical protein